MSQADYDIADQSGLSFLAELNTTLDAILSNNSGATAPTTTTPYQWWADTTAGILKQRNAADDGWINILTLGSTVLETANNLSDIASAATAFNNIKQPASETVTGAVEKATTAEAESGTADKFPDAAGVVSAISANAGLVLQIAVNAQTGTTYTLVLDDAYRLVTMDNAAFNVSS